MTFNAILIKEMRLRTRRERTIWALVLYVLLLGLLAWLTLNSTYVSKIKINQWSNIGYGLYHVLTAVQMLLILLITPAFTATAINGEKEHQTYEMLICSRLSSFSLVTGKLLAGLSNSLLLIAAAIPLFSLILFLGGVAPLTMLQDLLTFVITAVMVATLGFLCSTLFPRPAVSTAVTYMLVLLWLVMPLMLQYFMPLRTYTGNSGGMLYTDHSIYIGSSAYYSSTLTATTMLAQTPALPLITAWNPLVALNDTFFLPFGSSAILYTIYGIQQGTQTYSIARLTFTAPVAYAILSSLATLFFFALSLCFAKPNLLALIRARLKRQYSVRTQHQETSTITTA